MVNDIERLREALTEVCDVLGSGACMMVQCEGCSFEMTEASSIAHEALGKEFPPKADHHAHLQRLQRQAVHDENRRAHDEILDVLKRLDSPSLKGAIPDKVRQLTAKARREQMEAVVSDCYRAADVWAADGRGDIGDALISFAEGYRTRFEEKNK